MLALLAVVLAKRSLQFRHRIHGALRFHDRFPACELAHQPIHVLELSLRRPAGVARGPHRLGMEPHGERFCEVFVRVALGVPAIEMLNEALTVRFGSVVLGIWRRRRAKYATPRGA